MKPFIYFLPQLISQSGLQETIPDDKSAKGGVHPGQTEVPSKNPCRQRENMHTPRREAAVGWNWTHDLAVRRKCLQLQHHFAWSPGEIFTFLCMVKKRKLQALPCPESNPCFIATLSFCHGAHTCGSEPSPLSSHCPYPSCGKAKTLWLTQQRHTVIPHFYILIWLYIHHSCLWLRTLSIKVTLSLVFFCTWVSIV